MVTTFSFATAWFVTDYVEADARHQGRVITQVLADNSVFSLLVPGDALVTQSTANTLNAFPVVRFAEVVDTAFNTVLAVGERTPTWSVSRHVLPVDEVTLAHEDRCCWHFVAPVNTTEGEPTEVQLVPPRPLRLGYVHVVATKEPVQNLIGSIVIAELMVAVLFSLIIGGYLWRRLRSLTQPLVNLQGVMSSGLEKTEPVRAALEGPQEVRQIAQVFNELMAYRESQSASLEKQVQVRTQQLEFARDEALKAEREKSEIMAMFTHEMKAPLHAMDSYLADASSQLDFVADKETADRIRQALQIIGAESRKLYHRINQILELRSLESGTAHVNVSDVNIPRVLHWVDRTLRPLSLRNGNTLNIDHRGEANIRFDEDKLVRILENVVSNASRFTQNGEVSLSVHGEKHQLTIDIRDQGVGIAPKHHAQIFTPFYQVDMSATREYAGTGLGLAIVKRLTDLLGGQITLTSAQGQGTRLVITFPLPLEPRSVQAS